MAPEKAQNILFAGATGYGLEIEDDDVRNFVWQLRQPRPPRSRQAPLRHNILAALQVVFLFTFLKALFTPS